MGFSVPFGLAFLIFFVGSLTRPLLGLFILEDPGERVYRCVLDTYYREGMVCDAGEWRLGYCRHVHDGGHNVVREAGSGDWHGASL